ncbi:MAG TPA: phenylalanine--tRNA ligase subunit alpha, partial [Alphaproteobacteria bacterium]|nr:phenylalanine--tRNA ligase subunit alpha [Alphaproteobacteria bacterium]
MDQIEALEQELLAAVAAADDLAALEGARVAALGKKGRITEQMKGLGGLDPEARRSTGAALNAVKDRVAAALDARTAELKRAELSARLLAERIDVTLPARPAAAGTIHPISQTIEELVAIFGDMGFALAEGPDIEDDWHNFTALNIGPAHPARQMHDTFYLAAERDDGMETVLRTHTSPVQIRTMLSQKPPIRVICPGRT